jgi:hypothetical protein
MVEDDARSFSSECFGVSGLRRHSRLSCNLGKARATRERIDGLTGSDARDGSLLLSSPISDRETAQA